MEIIRNSDASQLLKKAALQINKIFEKRKSLPTLFLVSGGSAFDILDGIEVEHFGPNSTIGVLDERYSKDEGVNNFSLLEKTSLYAKARENRASFIDTKIIGDESIDELASRFEDALRNWKTNNPNGFVVVTQGVGSDGHTAGIMPYPEDPEVFKKLFENEEKWVIGYDATVKKNPYPQRVTTTMSFLRNIVDVSIVYVVGDEKKEALYRIVSQEGSLWETPARIIRDMKNAKLFTNIE